MCLCLSVSNITEERVNGCFPDIFMIGPAWTMGHCGTFWERLFQALLDCLTFLKIRRDEGLCSRSSSYDLWWNIPNVGNPIKRLTAIKLSELPPYWSRKCRYHMAHTVGTLWISLASKDPVRQGSSWTSTRTTASVLMQYQVCAFRS